MIFVFLAIVSLAEIGGVSGFDWLCYAVDCGSRADL